MVKKNQDQITAHKIYFVFHQINYSQGSCAYQKRLDSMQFTALKFNKKLSSGGFGIVYLAEERKTKQKVAIKAI